MLGPHPGDKKPVELHSGRYGPYVKHGDINATLPDRDKVDSLTLEDAVALLAEKAAMEGTGSPSKAKRPIRAKTASEPRAAYAAAAKVRKPTVAKKAAVKRTPAASAKRASPLAAKATPKSAPKTKPAAKARRISAK